jgi:hypothetical protein
MPADNKASSLKEDPVDPLTGSKKVEVKNQPGEQIATPEDGTKVVGPGADARGNIQLSNTLQKGERVLSDDDADQLTNLKVQALGLVKSVKALGNTDEAQEAVKHIRMAMFWVHAHMTTDTKVHPQFLPDDKAI